MWAIIIISCKINITLLYRKGTCACITANLKRPPGGIKSENVEDTRLNAHFGLNGIPAVGSPVAISSSLPLEAGGLPQSSPCRCLTQLTHTHTARCQV